MNWFENAVFYHIYPIGYFGCPRQNDFTSEPTHKILRVIDDIPAYKGAWLQRRILRAGI